MTPGHADHSQPPRAPRPRLIVWGFWAYAAALFIATHWPRLEVPGPEGSDKWVHCVVFGTWMVLATACGWFGPPLSPRNLAGSWMLSLAYAGLDEGLQAIPAVHRSCEWLDFLANAAGITLALCWLLPVAVAMGLSRRAAE